MTVRDSELLFGERLIINFPSKLHWKLPSKYEYIESGLNVLAAYLKENMVKSLALPALRCGNGGLNWFRVKSMIEKPLSDLDADIWVYEPELCRRKSFGLPAGQSPPLERAAFLTPEKGMGKNTARSIVFDLIYKPRG